MARTVECLPDVPFTTRQARDYGLGRGGLLAAVQERRVVRLLRGVYLRADVEVTPVIRAQAASRVISAHSVACDRTAAWIWGVDAFEYSELDSEPALETFVLRGHDPTDRPQIDGGTRDLLPGDWVYVGGVRVTTPLRTAMDLGCKLSRRSAIAAMDALMRLHQFKTADLRRLLPRYFRRRGCVQLRELVPLVDGRAESSGESWTRLEIVDAGLPIPEPNHWVMVDGVPKYRLDLAYPHARIVIEYDGEEFHSSDEAKAHDCARRKWLEDHGWIVMVVDKDSFTERAIFAWIAELRCHLESAQTRGKPPRRRTRRTTT